MTLVCTYLKGLRTARCRSTAMAVSVKMLTLTLNICTNGQKAHMKCGKFQRCSSAAWNWSNNDVCNNPIQCCIHLKSNKHVILILTLYLLTWRIWWAPNNASKVLMEFNSGFKRLRYFYFVANWLPKYRFSSCLS